MKLIQCIIICVILTTSCSPAMKMLDTWKDPSFNLKDYKSVGVVLMSPNQNTKAAAEPEIARELVKNGIKASATFDIFAFAGNSEALSEINKGLTEEEINERIKGRVKKFGYDAILIMTVLDKEQEVEKRGGNVGLGVSAPYYYNYAGYYSYAYSTISTPSYYETTTTYITESNIYDVDSEKLLWSGHSKLVNPDDLDKDSKMFAEIIVNEILK